MWTLIHNLLDSAKIEAGRVSLELRAEAVTDVVEEALGLIRPLAEAKHIALSWRATAAPPIRVDRARVFQVFANLLGNAVKFTPEQGRVAVSVVPQRDAVLFTVSDSGPGIAADQMGMSSTATGRPAKRAGRGPASASTSQSESWRRTGGISRSNRSWARGRQFSFTLPLA